MRNQTNVSKANASTAQKHADFYKAFWEKSGTDITPDEAMRIRFIVSALERHIPHQNETKILDLGCGRGWMAPFLSQYGTVTGVDFTATSIEAAQEHFGLYADFRLADSNSQVLGLEDKVPFDVVICSEVIEHVFDSFGLLSQIHGFLKLGGLCVLTTPNAHRWKQFSAINAETLQPIENWLTPLEIVSMAHKAGFVVLTHEGKRPYQLEGMRQLLLSRKFSKLLDGIGLSELNRKIALQICLYQMLVLQSVAPSS